MRIAVELEERRREADELMTKLMIGLTEDPEVRALLLRKIKELGLVKLLTHEAKSLS